MHLDEETLQRLLHGELAGPGESRARTHLASCRECARRLEEAAREEERIFGLLETLDHAPPATGPESILAGGPAPERWRSRIAAGVAFLLVVGGIAVAVPGSPVRDWVRGALRGEPPPAAVEADRPGEESVAGVSVDPGELIEVAFEESQERGRILVRLVRAPELQVRIHGGSPGIRVHSDRIVVANAGSAASYEILVPESAPRVRVRVGARVLFEKEDEEARAPTTRSEEGWVLPLRPDAD